MEISHCLLWPAWSIPSASSCSSPPANCIIPFEILTISVDNTIMLNSQVSNLSIPGKVAYLIKKPSIPKFLLRLLGHLQLLRPDAFRPLLTKSLALSGSNKSKSKM